MSETHEVIDRLRKVKFEYGMSSLGRMAAIGRAILPSEKGWMWTTDSCEMLKNKLISLLESAWNGGFDDGFASADDWCAENEDAMREHGWVRVEDAVSLPVDINGDRVHAGDLVIAQNGKSYRVECVALRNNDTWCVVITDGFSDPHVLGIYVDCDTVRVVKGTQ